MAFPERSHSVPGAFPEGSVEHSWRVSRTFPHHSQSIPSMFPQRSHSIPRTFPEGSWNVPGEFLEGSWSAPRAFPIYSQGIPRVFPGVFPQRSCNIPGAFLGVFLQRSWSVPRAFLEPSRSSDSPSCPHQWNEAFVHVDGRPVVSSSPLLPSHHSFLSSRLATPLPPPPQLSRTSRQFAASPASKRGCSIVCTCRCTSHPFSDIKAFW